MSKQSILYIALGLLLVGLLVGGFVAYRAPLGPALNLPPATQMAAAPTQAAVIAPTQASSLFPLKWSSRTTPWLPRLPLLWFP